MLLQKLAHYLRYGLVGVLYAILLTPLVLPTGLLFPFITGKTVFFRLAVEAAIFLYVWLALVDKNYRPKMNLLTWLMVVFGGIVFLTGLTGVNFYKSFWGTIERGEGFLTVSHLIIYFLILIWTFKSKKEWLNYLTGAVIVGFLVDGYALLQKLKVEKFLWLKIIHSGEGRLSATIGNAAFLGAYTLQIFYLSLLLFFERKQLVGKVFFVVSGILSLFVLYHTQTRGALLGLLITLPLLILFFIFGRGGEKIIGEEKIRRGKIIALSILLFIIALGTTVWFNRNSAWVKNQPTLNRLANISKNDITTQSRFFAWDSSWKGWKDRFLLGYGWENYNIAFNKYFHAEIFMDQGSQLWFDRAHNTVFDVAVATGLFGILVYLAIFGAALRNLWRASKISFWGPRILMAALAAHFLQNIFVFDVLSTYILMFNLFGFTVFLSSKQSASPASGQLTTNNQQTTNNKQHTASDEIYTIPAAIVLLVLIFCAYVFNLKPLKANKVVVEALIASSGGAEQKAVDIFKTAIDLGTYQTSEARQKLADNILVSNTNQNGLTNEQVAKNYELSITELKNNIRQAPLDVQNYLYLMAVLNRSASFDARRLQEAIDWGEQAIKLSPARPQTYFEMGQAYIGMKKYDEAIAVFKKGVDLNPNTMESRWNLMAAFIVAGKDGLAKEQQDFMASKGYDFNYSENLQRLYRIYAVAGRMNEMILILEKIAELYPSGDAYAKLAAGYAQIGEKEKARAAVAKAVELNPALQTEARKFLEMLK